MSDTMAGLRRKINSATELHSVVRTMKALAASNMGEYERSLVSLTEYYRIIEVGLGACFRNAESRTTENPLAPAGLGKVGAIVFGSDQGLVGQFNDVVGDYAIEALSRLPAQPRVWVVGERLYGRLSGFGLSLARLYPVPSSIKAVTSLVSQLQLESEALHATSGFQSVYIFHNRPKTGTSYEPAGQRLLPLDERWRDGLSKVQWPNGNLPEITCGADKTFRTLIREYLFMSLFRACAESLASENASRLAAMERAEKNIDDLMVTLSQTFHRMRQGAIDEELFDVISGFEAMGKPGSRSGAV